MNKKKLAIIATSPLVVKHHLHSIIDSLNQQYSIVVMINMSESIESIQGLPEGVKYLDTKMERKINLFADIKTVFLLYRFLKKESISIVYTVSPKAGFLGICVSRILQVPIRIHTFTGQVWRTKTGPIKLLLKILDKAIYQFSSKVIVDSQSQKLFLIEQNIICEERSIVIGSGSLGGVDTKLFSPNESSRTEIRKNLSIGSDDIVFLFIGRLNIDKGIIELIKAYYQTTKQCRNTFLILVGPIETDVAQLHDLIRKLNIDSIIFLPYTQAPETFMAASDIFCLPSYREGFGTVIIESAACGIPSVGSRIYGLTDAIIDQETGFLVEVGDIDGLSEKMTLLASDTELRKRLGNMAMHRARSSFGQEKVVQGLLDFIDKEVKTYLNS